MHKCCCHWVWVHATGGVAEAATAAAAAGGGAGGAGGVGDCHAGSWWCLPHDVRTMRAHNSGCQTGRQADRLCVSVCVCCMQHAAPMAAHSLARSFIHATRKRRAHTTRLHLLLPAPFRSASSFGSLIHGAHIPFACHLSTLHFAACLSCGYLCCCCCCSCRSVNYSF